MASQEPLLIGKSCPGLTEGEEARAARGWRMNVTKPGRWPGFSDRHSWKRSHCPQASCPGHSVKSHDEVAGGSACKPKEKQGGKLWEKCRSKGKSSWLCTA